MLYIFVVTVVPRCEVRGGGEAATTLLSEHSIPTVDNSTFNKEESLEAERNQVS